MTEPRIGRARYSVPYAHSAILRRPVVKWPGAARVAVWVVLNVEYFLPEQPTSGGSRGTVPDVPNIAMRDYGARVGFWRLLELFDRIGIRPTVAMNGLACIEYPEIVDAGQSRGWEWIGHGLTNSQRLTGLSASAERQVIRETTRLISDSTGARPRGWLGPGLAETRRTLDLLLSEGYTYVADWCADEQPFLMHPARGPILALPYSQDINDYVAFVASRFSAEQFYELVSDQFEVLHRDSAASSRVMAIALHPYLSGQAYRSKWIERALLEISQQSDVWFATGSAIADSYLAQVTPSNNVGAAGTSPGVHSGRDPAAVPRTVGSSR